MIDVKTRVDEGDGGEDVVPEVAFVFGVVGGRRGGERTFGGEGEVFVQVVGVAAGFSAGVEVGGEGGVESEERCPDVDEGGGGDYKAVRRWR